MTHWAHTSESEFDSSDRCIIALLQQPYVEELPRNKEFFFLCGRFSNCRYS